MELLSVKNLEKQFEGQSIFSNINISIQEGEFVSIVGKSGAGKSTLLKMLGGLEQATAGEIVLVGADKPILVFQEYNKSIFPWLTVYKNVLLISQRKYPKKEAQAKAKEYLQLVGLEDALHKYPWELSGGMQQRVALARALAYQPKILLLDEPFGSLDAGTRRDLEIEVQKLWTQLNITIVLVTHDIDEAIFLSNRVLVMNGKPAQISEEMPIELAFPRDYYTIVNSEAFIAYRKKIMQYFL